MQPDQALAAALNARLAAEHLLSALERRYETAAGRAAEIDAERLAIAFAGIGEGDQLALRRLDELGLEELMLPAQRRAIAMAINQARRNVDLASVSERKERNRIDRNLHWSYASTSTQKAEIAK